MRRPLLRSHPASVEVSMPSLTSSRVARGVRPSPQTFSRGKWAFSRTRTSRPARARYAAVVEPPGPAPTTMTSALVGTSDGGYPVNRFVGFTVSSPVGDEHGSAYVPRCDNAIRAQPHSVLPSTQHPESEPRFHWCCAEDRRSGGDQRLGGGIFFLPPAASALASSRLRFCSSWAAAMSVMFIEPRSTKNEMPAMITLIQYDQPNSSGSETRATMSMPLMRLPIMPGGMAPMPPICIIGLL